MLDITKALKIEKKKYKTSTSIIYYFKCSNCDNTIKSEKKYLNKHSGKCRYCCHKGTPYLSSYNHFKDGVNRTNKKRKKQKTVELTFEEFLEFTKINNCTYCNKEITWVKHSGTGQFRTNLDRKDSDKGYSKENCVVSCKDCNRMKSDLFSYAEFKEVVKLIDKMRKGEFIKK